MKKLAFLIITMLFSFLGFSQTDKALVGKWKVTMIDAGIYHNYKNDSTHVSDIAKKSLAGDADSAFVITLVSGMIAGYKNYYFHFKEDGSYTEIKNGKVRQEGIYTTDINKHQLTQTGKNKLGQEHKEVLQYNIKGKVLELSIPSKETPIKFELERED